jgi:hypothetical protein
MPRRSLYSHANTISGFLEGQGRIFEAMQITAPLEDGILGFKYSDQPALAEYLRRRFRIAEFK